MIAASLARSALLFGSAQLEPPSEVQQHIQRGVDLYDNVRGASRWALDVATNDDVLGTPWAADRGRPVERSVRAAVVSRVAPCPSSCPNSHFKALKTRPARSRMIG